MLRNCSISKIGFDRLLILEDIILVGLLYNKFNYIIRRKLQKYIMRWQVLEIFWWQTKLITYKIHIGYWWLHFSSTTFVLSQMFINRDVIIWIQKTFRLSIRGLDFIFSWPIRFFQVVVFIISAEFTLCKTCYVTSRSSIASSDVGTVHPVHSQSHFLHQPPCLLEPAQLHF